MSHMKLQYMTAHHKSLSVSSVVGRSLCCAEGNKFDSRWGLKGFSLYCHACDMMNNFIYFNFKIFKIAEVNKSRLLD